MSDIFQSQVTSVSHLIILLFEKKKRTSFCISFHVVVDAPVGLFLANMDELFGVVPFS